VNEISKNIHPFRQSVKKAIFLVKQHGQPIQNDQDICDERCQKGDPQQKAEHDPIDVDVYEVVFATLAHRIQFLVEAANQTHQDVTDASRPKKVIEAAFECVPP